MGWVDATSVGSLTAATAAALLTAALSPISCDGVTPLVSELICWLLVLTVIRLFPLPSLNRSNNHGVAFAAAPTYTYWIIASSIAATAVSSSFFDATWSIPLVAFTLIALSGNTLITRLQAWLPGNFRHSWLALSMGVMLLLSVVPSLDTKQLAFAAPTALGLIGIYGSLIHLFGRFSGEIHGQVRSHARHVIFSIAIRAIGLLAMMATIIMFVWPGNTLSTINAVFTGSMKAAHWVVIFWLTQDTRWEIAPTIWAYVSVSENSLQSIAAGPLGQVQTFARIVVAALSLYQIIDFIPKTEKPRMLLVAFAIWSVLSVWQNTSFSGHVPSLPGVTWPGTSNSSPYHPVEPLIRKAQVDFEHLVKRQSRTLESAETEYRRRYSRDPPPGFDKWFSYAQSKNSILIDDFDMIDEDLKPFWKIPPQRLRESIDHVSSIENLALRKCGISDGQYYGQEGDWIVNDLGKLLGEVANDIPNVDFAVNILDEPRVIITQQMLEIGGVSKPEFYDAHHVSIWNRTTEPCEQTPTKGNSPASHDLGLPLVQDWYHTKDVCSHPEFGLMHGFFSSPMTCVITDAPIPVLSQGAPTTFGDIVYPSPWYAAKMDQGDYNGGEDPLWEQKSGNLYWAGSTTGSYSWNGTWHYSHRQRLAKLVQTLNHTNYAYLKESKPGHWTSYRAIENHSNLFDVKFTAAIQCDDQDCAEQNQFCKMGEREERSRQFHSQFVFDTDGNSFSGRFYTLLRSRSAVLKQTVLREWHDERLIPWVHFIPVSLSMDELPELMRYMTSHEDGKRRAKDIAERAEMNTVVV